MDLRVIQSPQMTTKAEPQLFIATGIRERDVKIAVPTAPFCDFVRLFEKPEERLVAAKPDDGFARSVPRFGHLAKQDVLKEEAAKVLPDLPEADFVVFFNLVFVDALDSVPFQGSAVPRVVIEIVEQPRIRADEAEFESLSGPRGVVLGVQARPLGDRKAI